MTESTVGGFSSSTQGALNAVHALQRDLAESFVGREDVVRALVLGVVCQEHVLLVGPPGTAKTDLIQRFTGRIRGAQLFRYLLTRFTEPAELFGPLDVRAFTEDRVYRLETSRMLPDADVAFLDEVFEGSSAILNSLLTLMHERVFANGSEAPRRIPLLSLVSASHRVPSDPGLEAFTDRFMLRVPVERVASARWGDLLTLGWEAERDRIRREAEGDVHGGGELVGVTRDQLVQLHRNLGAVRLDQVRPVYQEVVTELVQLGLPLTDRRVVRAQKLVAGAALLRGADVARPRDLWPLMFLSTDPAHRDLLDHSVGARLEQDAEVRTAERRSAPSILAEARVLRARAGDRPGQLREPDYQAVLAGLGALRAELGPHPHDAAAMEEVNRLIDEVFEPISLPTSGPWPPATSGRGPAG